jgi:amino acid transporter
MSIVQLKPIHVGQVKLNLKNHSPENILNNTNFCYFLFVICYLLFVISYLLFVISYLLFLICYLLFFKKKAKNPLFYFS